MHNSYGMFEQKKVLHLTSIDASLLYSRLNTCQIKDNNDKTHTTNICASTSDTYKHSKDCLKAFGGGKSFQKCGERLEKAIYKCMPDAVKKYTKCNFKPIATNGDIIVEYDLLYYNKATKTVVTFEIKGMNKYTCTNERKDKILEQLLNQQKNSRRLFENHTIYNVLCIIDRKSTRLNSSH